MNILNIIIEWILNIFGGLTARVLQVIVGVSLGLCFFTLAFGYPGEDLDDFFDGNENYMIPSFLLTCGLFIFAMLTSTNTS